MWYLCQAYVGPCWALRRHVEAIFVPCLSFMLSQERVPFKLLPGPKGTRRCRIMSGRCRGFHYQSWLSFPPSQVFILSIKIVIWGIWGYIFSDKAIFSHPSLDERSTIKAKQRSYVVQKCKIQATIIHYLLLSDIFARTLFFYHSTREL